MKLLKIVLLGLATTNVFSNEISSLVDNQLRVMDENIRGLENVADLKGDSLELSLIRLQVFASVGYEIPIFAEVTVSPFVEFYISK